MFKRRARFRCHFKDLPLPFPFRFLVQSRLLSDGDEGGNGQAGRRQEGVPGASKELPR